MKTLRYFFLPLLALLTSPKFPGGPALGQSGTLFINNNVLDSCQHTSIYIYNSTSVVIRGNKITNSQTSGSNYYGIYVGSDKSTTVQIKSNSVTGNHSSGIYINRSIGTIDSNLVQNNQGIGIILNGNANFPTFDTLRYNTITGNNGDGIQNNGYSNLATNFNNLFGNKGFDFRDNAPASASATLDARYNWWGTATTAEMNAGRYPTNITKIYDNLDSPTLGLVNYSQWRTGTIVTAETNTPIPERFALDQNYPNPFNFSTNIRYTLPRSGRVNLEVYSTLGQRVATLVDQEQESGGYETRFSGNDLASGVYFYRLKVTNSASENTNVFIQTKKLILLK